MAWNAPITWTTNQTVTAAQLNTQISQNMLETAPAKATLGSYPQHFVVASTNSIAAREIKDNIVSTQESTTSTSFTDLATVGAEVTVSTGSFALVFPASRVFNTAGGVAYASFVITGATTGDSASDARGVANQGSDDIRAASVQLMAATAGVNVFTMQYRVSSATGTFQSRRLCVMGL